MQNEMTVLGLLLHGQIVGHLTGFRDGRNVLSFADSFRANPARPTFSLITHPDFPNSDKLMQQPWAKRLKETGTIRYTLHTQPSALNSGKAMPAGIGQSSTLANARNSSISCGVAVWSCQVLMAQAVNKRDFSAGAN